MEGKMQMISVDAFTQMLENRGLVIVPKNRVDIQMVDGIPMSEYRRQILNKRMISCYEIAAAKIWGDIAQKRVYQLVKELVPEKDQIPVGKKRTIKIPRSIVRNIAISRGVASGD